MSRTYLITGAVITLAVAAFLASVFMRLDRDDSPRTEQLSASYESYSNDEFGFRLQKPTDANVSKEGENRMKFTLLGQDNSPNTEISDGFTLTITSETNIPASTSLEEYAEERMMINKSNGSPILADLALVTAAGMNAYRYSFKNLLDKTTTEYVFLPQPGRGYAVSYTIAGTRNNGYQEMVREMINSLTFTNNASAI